MIPGSRDPVIRAIYVNNNPTKKILMMSISISISRVSELRWARANTRVERNIALLLLNILRNRTRMIPLKKTSSQIPRVKPLINLRTGTNPQSSSNFPVRVDAK